MCGNLDIDTNDNNNKEVLNESDVEISGVRSQLFLMRLK